jgi:hypothetical protein
LFANALAQSRQACHHCASTAPSMYLLNLSGAQLENHCLKLEMMRSVALLRCKVVMQAYTYIYILHCCDQQNASTCYSYTVYIATSQEFDTRHALLRTTNARNSRVKELMLQNAMDTNGTLKWYFSAQLVQYTTYQRKQCIHLFDQFVVTQLAIITSNSIT